MSLIEFQDLPNTDTPINAENLNHNFNELNQGNTYSTKETFIGKYWIDGKKIYRKTYTGTYNETNTLNIPHELSNYMIVNISGVTINPSSNTAFLLNNVRPAYQDYETGVYVNSVNIVIETTGKQNRTGQTAYITLEYIKTNE